MTIKRKSPLASPVRTVVAVFDGGRAVLFENTGFDDAPALRRLYSCQNHVRPTREQGHDRPGRYPTPSGGRFAVAAPDLHERKEREFIADVAAVLERQVAAGELDRLVVLAPSRAFAILREAAPGAASRLVAHYDRDLTRSPLKQIERAVLTALTDQVAHAV